LQVYEPKFQSTRGRIYYSNSNNQLVSTDFTVSFLDFDAKLDAATLSIYQGLDSVIASLSTGGTVVDQNFVNLLIQLRDNLIDTSTTKSNVVAIKDYQAQNTLTLDATQEAKLQSILNMLSDKSVVSAL